METISSGVDLLKLMKFGRILSRFQKLAAEKIGKVESQSSLNTLPLFRLGDSATQRCFNSRDTKEFQEDIVAIFKKTDAYNSGTTTLKEFQAVMEQY
ncbi:uncharacterized protein LOC131594126 isoform X2 [Vicia villosa]|uniref:uncharacterized protein LOC131594126 isoform X2 n=1 Tax=Vicia villosa TaxID=3911 RepID=UPI00273ACF61|nr:uncharacterized protein LOC131594126 isoform X2 [Vicia villosa]